MESEFVLLCVLLVKYVVWSQREHYLHEFNGLSGGEWLINPGAGRVSSVPIYVGASDSILSCMWCRCSA